MSKQLILEAAAQIFSQKGYHATSMQDIASAVDLKKASLYHHISSKQEILLALLNQALDLVIAQVNEALSVEAPYPEKLRRAMRTYLETLVANRELSAVLLFEYRSLEGQRFSQHTIRRDRFERLWRDQIQSGVDAGIFRCQAPAPAARALLGMMNWTITWYRPEGPSSPQEIADQYAGMLINGLLTREVVA